MLNVSMIRKDFPELQREVFGRQIAYLDNCATTLKPVQVIKAIVDCYCLYYANIYRGSYLLSVESTEAYEYSRKKIASFFGAKPHEIIFVRNSTEGINLAASALAPLFKKGDNVVTTLMEHHSNLLPWYRLKNVKTRFVKLTREGKLDYEDFKKKVDEKTRLISLVHVSNVLGTINDVDRVRELAERVGALLFLDAAQSAPHLPLNVKSLGVDFMAVSGHKMLGPTGIGVLYVREELMEDLPMFMVGGEVIEHVFLKNGLFTHDLKIEWKKGPERFEAGTPNIVGAIGLAAAVDYLERIGMHEVREHERKLTEYALEQIGGIEGIRILGPQNTRERGGVLSFNLGGMNPHEVALKLDRFAICTRSGHHCAEPLHNFFGVRGSVRASFYIYNTEEEIDRLRKALLIIKKGGVELKEVLITNPLEDLLNERRNPVIPFKEIQKPDRKMELSCKTCAYKGICSGEERGWKVFDEEITLDKVRSFWHMMIWRVCPAMSRFPFLERAFREYEKEVRSVLAMSLRIGARRRSHERSYKIS